MAKGKLEGIKIKLIKLGNRLKIKGGMSDADNRPGILPEKSIREADKIIEDLCKTCPETVGQHLEDLDKIWDEMRDMPQSEERKALAEQAFTLAHEIKDISAMCGYELSAYFAESLRDYVGKTELQLDAQRVIIQAHLDALGVVHKQGLKDDGGPMADELKKLVKVAIEKYS